VERRGPEVYADTGARFTKPEAKPVMLPLLANHRTEIAELCRRFSVARLEVFGSAARGSDFDPVRSDIDFLVVYLAEHVPSLDQFFALRGQLSALLGRKVDLVTAGSVENPYVRSGIEQDKQVLYAA
jgi:predicted nucleotidyltransferase